MKRRRKISYRHPNRPGQIRYGYILTSGRDGHTVEHCDTGEEERVRHEDVVSEHPSVDASDDADLGEGAVTEDLEKSLAGFFSAPDALKVRAARYADQYVPGHPARVHPDDLDWHYVTRFPLHKLPGSKDEWLKWHKETDGERNLDYAAQPYHQRALFPIVVAQGTDGNHYVWDGNRRVAETHAAGEEHIPAIVGTPRNAHRPLPPGGEGRSGLRKSLTARAPLPLLLKATDAYTKLRQRSSVAQVMSRLQANAKAGQPGAGAAGRDRLRRENARPGGGGGGRPSGSQWGPLNDVQPPHDLGNKVHYQTPWMREPAIGKIESLGQHGAWVSSPEGKLHKVRHEHILGSALDGLPPDWRQAGAEALRGQGAPIDPLEQYLLPDRQERPRQLTMERLKALAADGAPIDLERLAHAPEGDARKVIERFAGKIDHGDGEMPVVTRKKQAGGARLYDPYKVADRE